MNPDGASWLSSGEADAINLCSERSAAHVLDGGSNPSRPTAQSRASWRLWRRWESAQIQGCGRGRHLCAADAVRYTRSSPLSTNRRLGIVISLECRRSVAPVFPRGPRLENYRQRRALSPPQLYRPILRCRQNSAGQHRNSASGVSINLATGGVGGDVAVGDVFKNFEDVFWSDFTDGLMGGNVLAGFGGNDVLVGGQGARWAALRARGTRSGKDPRSRRDHPPKPMKGIQDWPDGWHRVGRPHADRVCNPIQNGSDSEQG